MRFDEAAECASDVDHVYFPWELLSSIYVIK